MTVELRLQWRFSKPIVSSSEVALAGLCASALHRPVAELRVLRQESCERVREDPLRQNDVPCRHAVHFA